MTSGALNLWVSRQIVLLVFIFTLFLPKAFCFELPYKETYFQDHRCLVVMSEGLPDDAPVILALHGALGNGEESFGVFYQGSELPQALWLFPDGLIRVRQKSRRATVIRHAWYDRFTHSYADMKKSREFLIALLDYYAHQSADADQEGKPLAKPRPVVIVGESQGGIMTFETGLNYPGPILALASVDGFIEYPERTLARPLAPKNVHILMQNGSLDPVVQDEDAKATVGELHKRGYYPFLRFYGVGHKITQRMKDDLWGFLRGILRERKMTASGLDP